jgi:hypothetical protein
MKLWLLKPRKDLSLNDPWRPIYDMAFGFVVRAKTEGGARLMASKYGGDELKELAVAARQQRTRLTLSDN